MYKFDNLNQALIGMSKELLEKGIWRDTRGFKCLELPNPIIIQINNPTDRYITIPERKWNKYLGWIESLWLALGSNNLNDLPGKYVKSLYNFSDNGKTWRAAYSPRFRFYSGIGSDYDCSVGEEPKHEEPYYFTFTDQFKYVIETLKNDINSRQALITISDPSKDCFDKQGNLKKTKDQPCSRDLQFMVVNGKLDLSLTIRSNDILWGFSAINVFNFTLMQEYIANILGLEIGNYYHIAKNFHVYDNFIDKIKEFAKLDINNYKTSEPFVYSSKLKSLEDFDNNCKKLFEYENKISKGEVCLVDFNNDLFDDWKCIIFKFWNKDYQVEFKNPYLNKLFNK